ncbi:GntR family transcriptional regulator [Cesiribacter sp. SM1]|uniref:GntR family transcriptional regulator n=1 Tax=Cesiribacter sp. SM1 TaxID=2861196 RepID=UPI001CD610DB|nr:GntR family transcriptional regulator [Cesiribacter sp. SM1]
MKFQSFYDAIQIDDLSATPKYLQLANSIISAIEDGILKKDELLPSINEISFEYEVSRDTAEKGYKYLKELGVLNSFPRKGYFVANTDFRQSLKVFLLFNKLSAHKKIVYDAFADALGDHALIDFYIYNNDYSLFKKLLNNKKEDYSHYVIIPHFLEGGEKAPELINALPKEKLVLLDKQLPGIEGEYAAVYENFERDIFSALEEAREQLRKYQSIKLIFPENSYYPVEIVKGFKKFCTKYNFDWKVLSDISEEPIRKGEVYINVMEDDLIPLVERTIELNLKVGSEVGIISYNETPFKRIILNGITTISTDFRKLGAIAARLVLENSKEHIEAPFRLKLRNSL